MAWIEVIDRAVVFGAPGRGGEQPIDQDMRVGPQALATEKIQLIASIAVAITQLACLQFPPAFVAGRPAHGSTDAVAGDAQAARLQRGLRVACAPGDAAIPRIGKAPAGIQRPGSAVAIEIIQGAAAVRAEIQAVVAVMRTQPEAAVTHAGGLEIRPVIARAQAHPPTLAE